MRRKKRKEGKRKRGNDCDKGHCFSLGRKGQDGKGLPKSFKEEKDNKKRKARKGVRTTGKGRKGQQGEGGKDSE